MTGGPETLNLPINEPNVFKQEDKFDGKPYCIDGPDGQVVTLEEYPYSYMGIFDKEEEK